MQVFPVFYQPLTSRAGVIAAHVQAAHATVAVDNARATIHAAALVSTCARGTVPVASASACAGYGAD